MMNKDKAMKVWKNAHGNSVEAKDPCGKRIIKQNYGQGGNFGWEVDHINPKSNGGTDAFDNLQAVHWRTNECKGNIIGYNRGECPKGCKNY